MSMLVEHTFNPSKDTFIRATNPTQAFGGASGIRIGQANVGGSPQAISRGILDFDLSAFPDDKTPTSAILTLNVTTAAATAEPWKFLYNGQSDWVEGEATWQVYAGLNAWGSEGGDFFDRFGEPYPEYFMPTSTGQKAFDLLDMVLEAFSLDKILRLFGVQVDEGTNAFFDFDSRTGAAPPVLAVAYEVPGGGRRRSRTRSR